MHAPAVPATPARPAARAAARRPPRMLNWPRIRSVMILSSLCGLLLLPRWTSGFVSLMIRANLLGLLVMLVFGLFERWPKRLPRFVARWVLQVVAVGMSIPPLTAIVYWLSTPEGAPPFYDVPARMEGFAGLCILGLLFAPWAALGALVRQKEALARHQALAFELEKSELEREASDARLRLLQAQVAPHFLFNTLANIQALVDQGSPQAPAVLRSLVAYLRAAVPRLDEAATTLGREVELVRAYLELMHMRIPDRLQYTLDVDEAALGLACPPMTLLTLVENAVRHGIDPTEEGGRIEVEIERRGERCVIQVRDTGAGLRETDGGLGTGLSTLRERLRLAFGEDVRLRLSARQPRGVRAELDFPARQAARP